MNTARSIKCEAHAQNVLDWSAIPEVGDQVDGNDDLDLDL
jgi:hypothetical protein